MVRVIQRRRRPLTEEAKRERSKRYQVSRYGVWIDPWPTVLGTVPEKMVYAELMERGIFFEFQKWWRPPFQLQSNEWFRPDFYIPSLNMIIEVQGAYWHSKPAQIAKDAFKMALYQLSGIKVVAWWDYDIETKLDQLFASVPGLAYYRKTPIIKPIANKSGIDDTKANKAINFKKRKPWTKKAVSVKMKRKKRNLRRYYNV